MSVHPFCSRRLHFGSLDLGAEAFLLLDCVFGPRLHKHALRRRRGATGSQQGGRKIEVFAKVPSATMDAWAESGRTGNTVPASAQQRQLRIGGNGAAEVVELNERHDVSCQLRIV